MLRRVASMVTVWSGLATGLALVVAAVYFVWFALSGGLQTSLATDAPPTWALTESETLAGIIVLYLLAAVVFTVSLAVVQFHTGPWWAVVGGLCALAAGAGLLVTGSQASEATYATIDRLAFMGLVGYMAATNGVALRARQFNGVVAAVGLASALLLLAATLAPGIAGAGLLALAIALYGAWAIWVGIAEWRQPAGARSRPAPLPASLQSQPVDR